jgi:hypothetical protein
MASTINFSSAGLIESSDTTGSLTIQTANTSAILCNVTTFVTTFSSTGALTLPVGTTAQRPASPVNGMLRYNTTLNKVEGYANSAWGVF